MAMIAAGWSVITRLEVTSTLNAWDIAALRFGVAGVLLAPVAMRRGLARNRLGGRGLAIFIAGGGAGVHRLADPLFARLCRVAWPQPAGHAAA
ncbi:MAG TPA: hypothetical protein VGG99_02235 [Acetobacteraceae bacterium]